MIHVKVTWSDLAAQVAHLAREIENSGWRPDYIVGITRGGLTPALMLSHMLNIKMYTLDVRLRDNPNKEDLESNCWMAEDAFGYVTNQNNNQDTVTDADLRKKILIVDDINDTGATFAWIRNDWQSSCLPNHAAWKSVWHDSVRFATLTDNAESAETVDYSAVNINKAEEDCWIVYPWEDWWK